MLMAMGMDMSEHQYLHQDKIQRADSFREERSEDDQDDYNGSGDGREDRSDRGKRSPDRASKSSRRSRKQRKTGRGKHGGRGSDHPSSDGEGDHHGEERVKHGQETDSPSLNSILTGTITLSRIA